VLWGLGLNRSSNALNVSLSPDRNPTGATRATATSSSMWEMRETTPPASTATTRWKTVLPRLAEASREVAEATGRPPTCPRPLVPLHRWQNRRKQAVARIRSLARRAVSRPLPTAREPASHLHREPPPIRQASRGLRDPERFPSATRTKTALPLTPFPDCREFDRLS